MTDLYQGFEPAADPAAPPPAAPRAPASLYEGFEEVAAKPAAAIGAPPREASGFVESVKAGFQGSAPGLAWRGKLPELVINPQNAAWWERAAAGITQVGAELPLMVGGALAGAPAGAAIGSPAGPPGVAAGTVLGAGFMMGALPGGIRESLIQAYKSGEVKTAADWWNIVREVATTAAKEGAINAAAMGTGALAGRAVGAAIAPGIGTKVAVPTAIRAIEAADVAAQIAAMPTIPAVLQGHLPDAQEFLDAAIVIGGLKLAHVTATNVATVYQRTGRTPAQQVADAQADPAVAADLATPQRPPVDPMTGTTSGVPVKLDRIIAEAEFLARGGVPLAPDIKGIIKEIKDAGPLQGDMIADIDRIGALYDQARQAPLTNPERAELDTLRARVAALEAAQRGETPPPAPEAAAFTGEQVADARQRANDRLQVLEAKTEALTDQERAERVFLKNATPEALARRFGMEPVRITRETAEASAQRVHDDVLRQLQDADQARREAGLAPLGDEHAAAVAALVRARVRARAARLGKLPEDIYSERPLQIRDETAAEVAALEAATPPEAQRFVEPEVDLFGDPVQPQVVPRVAIENLATVEVPLKDLVLSKEVPQFKNQADEKGVIVPLGGKFDRTGVGPIQVWERTDGTLEVISGRHRLDLARRSGEETIPAQIHREAEGFTAARAAALDAELNIREEQGGVADYVQHFKNSGLSEEAARELGLLARAKGKAGFAIARDGTADLRAAHRAGVLSDEAALVISAAAPGSDRLQALGMAMVQEGKSHLIAVNTMRAVDLMAAERMAAGAQGDIFGFDDSAMREASIMAKRASAQQRKISEQISAVNGASKRPELARQMGVDVQDPDGIQKRIAELRQEQTLWDNWPLHPELVAKLRAEGKGGVTGREGDLKQEPAPARVALQRNKAGHPELIAPDTALVHTRKFVDESQGGIDYMDHVVVGREGTPTGRVSLGWKGDKIEQLVWIHTDQAMQGRGYADAAFRAILEHNGPGAELHIVNILKDAREWYENRGVQFFKTETDEDGIATLETYRAARDRRAAAQEGPGAVAKALEGGREEDQRGAGKPEVAPAVDMRPETPAEKDARDAEAVDQTLRREGAQDSAAFKKWFGNSKAVDAEGKPLMLYHGTNADFAAFDKGKANNVGAWGEKAGFFFTPSQKQASKFAESYRSNSIGANVMPVFLSLQKPLMLDMVKDLGDNARELKAALESAEKNGYDGAIITGFSDFGGAHTQYVAFHPEQVKSVFNRGTYDPNDPNILHQSGPAERWYSALARAVEANPTKAMPVQGWKDWLRGQQQKGVKAEEVKWSGLEEWLDMQEGRVTKEQVHEFLRANGVKVTETVLGADNAIHEQAINDALTRLEEQGYEVTTEPYTGPENRETIATGVRNIKTGEEFSFHTSEYEALPQEVLDQMNVVWEYDNGQVSGDTKFGQYVLPGAKEGSYREVLLTLPRKGVKGNVERYEELNAIADRRALTDAEQREMVAIERAETGTSDFSEGTFRSSHFDQPNILAHVRLNERTDADGGRVLFIEEIQSDWAQKGKREGFSDAMPDKRAYWNEWRALDNLGNDRTPEQQQRFRELDTMALPVGAVPAAPFVGKTDAWVALVLKRMIRYAAENGMDRIAWTTGEQQVSRYTNALRKQVDAIEWTKTPEGVQLVGYKGKKAEPFVNPEPITELPEGWGTIYDRTRPEGHQWGVTPAGQAHARFYDDRAYRDEETAVKETVKSLNALAAAKARQEAERNDRKKVVDTTEKEDALSDAIGKAMAKRIIDDPAQSGTIEGDNIKIDDTGMATFYDRIVPNVAKDVLKKLGDGKIEETRIQGANGLEGFDLRDDPATGRWVLIGRFSGLPIEDAPTFRTGADAEKWVANHQTLPQQSFEITPAMRDKAMEGLPLFQKERGSYQIAEKLITTMQGADKSTVLHELGHDWLEEMKADAMRPDAPAQLKADWEILRRELAIGEDGTIERASHEQFARSVERYVGEGVAPSRELQGVFQRFRQWLLDIYQSLTNLNVQINPDLKAVLDRMLATDQEIADAQVLGVPRAYVAEAKVQEARKIVPGFKAEQVALEPYADELPPGPGSAPDDSHVNYAYINTPLDVKLTMQRMAEIDQANIQRQRGGTDGVKSWAEANAEQAQYVNDILGGNEDTLGVLSPRDPNAPGPDVKLGILKKLAVGAAKDSARLRDIVLAAGHDATVRQQLEYMGSIERARMIQAEFLGERAGVARALNALKDTTEGSGEIGRMLDAIGYGEAAAREANTLRQEPRTPEQEQALMRAKLDEILLNYKGKTVLDIAKLHKEIGTLKGTYTFAKEVTKATKWEMVIEGWRAGLLSGPVTHTTNLFGTGAFMSLRAPVDALAAVIGMARGASPGMGESDRASMSEALARMTGMLGGIQDGLKVALATFRLDDPTGKTEAYRTAIPGRAGELIRIPQRMMGAEDALVSTMYRRGELRTLAIRQAFDEGLSPATREFAARVDHLLDHPTPQMEAIAEAAATRMTFNSPLGEKGVALQLFVNKWNLQWMIPFIRTPINIAKELGRMSPFAPIVSEWRADIAKGGVARDRALAEMALGSGIMAVTMAYAFAGNVSGAGSPDPGKNRGKAGVVQPYSILIGDTWYEYARIAPTGTLMGLAADLAAVWDHATDEEKDKIPKMLAVAFSNAVTNQTFLQGITNFVNATSDPTRFAPRFLQQLAGSMVPNVIGQPTTMADPVVREVNSAVEAIMARVPGLRQELLPKRDWLGEPVRTKKRLGVVGPVRELKVSEDKVRLEAARLDISMAAAPKKTHLGKGTGKLGDVELTPEERDTFEKVGGEMAHKILGNIVNAQGYDEIPDLIKRRIFARVLSASHQVAAVAALPPAKRAEYLQQISEKVAAELTAPSD